MESRNASDVTALQDDSDYLADLLGGTLTNAEIETKWNVSERTIRRHRRNARKKLSETITERSEDSDGNFAFTIRHDREVTLADADKWVRKAGKDPDDYNLTVSSRAYGQGMWSNLIKATPKRKHGDTNSSLDGLFSRLVEEIKAPTPPAKPQSGTTPKERLFIPADLQLGKRDRLGGSSVSVRVFGAALAHALERAEQDGVTHVTIIDTGDAIEGFGNIPSQRETNDLDLTQQIELAFRLFYKAINAFVAEGYYVRFVSVPSNHCSVKVGKQALASTPGNDYGLLINRQLELVFGDRVEFVRPESDFSETATFQTVDGTKIAAIHGHQTNSPDKIGEWWKGQDHGRLPAWDADILITGHWHSMRVQHSGNARWLITAPSLEPSSSWFENIKGEQSMRGALHLTVSGGQWADLEVA